MVNVYDSEADSEVLWQQPVEFNELASILKKYCDVSKSKRRKFFNELNSEGEAFYSPPEDHPQSKYHISARSVSVIKVSEEVYKVGVDYEPKAYPHPSVELEESTFHPYRLAVYDTSTKMLIMANAEVNAKGVSEMLKKFCGLNHIERRNFLYVLRNKGKADHQPNPDDPRNTFSILATSLLGVAHTNEKQGLGE